MPALVTESGPGFIQRTWRAMGTEAEVMIVTGLDPADDRHASLAACLADLAVDRVAILEQAWSRFRPDSELSVLNRCAGRGATPASADLIELVERMQDSWSWTAGACDANVEASMRALGYDRDFADVRATHAVSRIPAATLVRGSLAEVDIDRTACTITLPAGVQLDPGSIGKGLAADIVCRELSAAGAQGVVVNLGGDLAVTGTWIDGTAWQVDLVDERAPEAPLVGRITNSAQSYGVATSTTLRRRWSAAGRTAHHVIDPRTGQPSATDLVQATVIAPTAWQAEAAATGMLVLGADLGTRWLTAQRLCGYAISRDGIQTINGGDHVLLNA